jgi:hypothetical protein
MEPKLRPCRYLRCKEMYYEPRGNEEHEFSGGVYWCAKTQEAFGPDGRPADRQECSAERTCFHR